MYRTEMPEGNRTALQERKMYILLSVFLSVTQRGPLIIRFSEPFLYETNYFLKQTVTQRPLLDNSTLIGLISNTSLIVKGKKVLTRSGIDKRFRYLKSKLIPLDPTYPLPVYIFIPVYIL